MGKREVFQLFQLRERIKVLYGGQRNGLNDAGGVKRASAVELIIIGIQRRIVFDGVRVVRADDGNIAQVGEQV